VLAKKIYILYYDITFHAKACTYNGKIQETEHQRMERRKEGSSMDK
jgi:hypothetical protein